MRRAIVLLVVFSLIAPAAAQTTGALTPVIIGTTGRPDQAPIDLAFARGYFAKQGIDLKMEQSGFQASDFISALGLNQIQVTAGSPNAAMLNAVNRGIDIRIVADWSRLGDATDKTQGFVVRQDLLDSGAVKTVADLKGRVLNQGPPGSANDLFFARVLDAGHFARGDITVETINFVDALAALANKKIDGGIFFEPAVYQATEQKKLGRVLVTGAKLAPGEELAVLFYSPDFAKQTKVATGFMIAYLEGLRDYYDAFSLGKGKDAAIDILVQRLALKDRDVWANSSPKVVDLNGEVNIPDIKLQAEFYKKEGFVTGAVPDIDKYVDPQFAAAAVKEIGKR